MKTPSSISALATALYVASLCGAVQVCEHRSTRKNLKCAFQGYLVSPPAPISPNSNAAPTSKTGDLLEDCYQACTRTPQCRTFALNTDDSSCLLYNKAPKQLSLAGDNTSPFIFYHRHCFVPTSKATGLQNVDSETPDIFYPWQEDTPDPGSDGGAGLYTDDAHTGTQSFQIKINNNVRYAVAAPLDLCPGKTYSAPSFWYKVLSMEACSNPKLTAEIEYFTDPSDINSGLLEAYRVQSLSNAPAPGDWTQLVMDAKGDTFTIDNKYKYRIRLELMDLVAQSNCKLRVLFDTIQFDVLPDPQSQTI